MLYTLRLAQLATPSQTHALYAEAQHEVWKNKAVFYMYVMRKRGGAGVEGSGGGNGVGDGGGDRSGDGDGNGDSTGDGHGAANGNGEGEGQGS